MEARLCRWLLIPVALIFVAAGQPQSGFTVRTRNFVVTSPTSAISQQVADAAETYRREIAIDWLGHELLPWYAPCPIFVKVGQIGAGGATTFSFHSSPNGPDEVCGWDMKIQGSLERILDSVLPHEISHTIFACHFRRPLPRWADEGAATLIEHESERKRQVLTVQQVLGTRRRIPLKTLLALKEYPKDIQDIMTLYAEGYSLADLLVQKGGKARYLKFLNDAHQRGWEKAIQSHYGFKGVDDLEKQWHEWVVAGSPPFPLPEGQQLAQTDAPPKNKPASGFEMRGQSPDKETDTASGRDPFLDTAVARNDLPRRRALPLSGEQSPAVRKAVAAIGATTAVVHEDWVAEENDNPASTSVGGESEEDDPLWVDAPRSRTRVPRGETERLRPRLASAAAPSTAAGPSRPGIAAGRNRGSGITPIVRGRRNPAGSRITGTRRNDVRARRGRSSRRKFPSTGRGPLREIEFGTVMIRARQVTSCLIEGTD
jgi:hypothetical protein